MVPNQSIERQWLLSDFKGLLPAIKTTFWLQKNQIISCIEQKLVALFLRTLACSKVGGNPGNKSARHSTVTRSKKTQENEKPEMCWMFFSMRWHYTTTFRCVAVIFGFFPKRIKPMISWQPLLFLFFLCFSFSLFLLKTGRKRMMTMFWSGEKARKNHCL